tara:strand:+ start:19 stop:438 length:420 start_codon:yes stop_codon:yes gene_type:complete
VALFLWLKYSMDRFVIETLVDITCTNEYRPSNGQQKYKQQQNFETVNNTIGMRTNITIENTPTVEKKKGNFGSFYNGDQNVWTYEFSIEQAESLSVEMLIVDFDSTPITTELTETASIKTNLFVTKGKYKNIHFRLLDK